MDGDLSKQWQLRLEMIPNPLSQHFAGGILQASDFIEALMVELLPQRHHRLLDLAIVNEVSLVLRDLTFHHDIHPEGVAVHPPAFVPVRERRQPMRRFKAK